MVSKTFGVPAASSVGAADGVAAGASLVTIFSGFSTPSMPMSSVSKTAGT